MKYTNEIVIKAPLEKVVKLFDNPENLKHWQPGLISFELISGKQGHPGAKAKLTFNISNRIVEMIETVEVRDLPREFSGTYEMKNIYNIIRNHFSSVDEHTTHYKVENEFKFKGFIKLVALLMPGSMKKQSQQYLELFKGFVEKEHHSK